MYKTVLSILTRLFMKNSWIHEKVKQWGRDEKNRLLI